MTARLRCTLTHDPDGNSATEVLYLRQEQGKKSAFVLDGNVKCGGEAEDVNYSFEKPAHLILDCCVDNDNKEVAPFLFGGLELVSNSRNVEVYTIGSDSKDGETNTNNKKNYEYLTTCRGIQIDHDDPRHLHRIVFVHPGGPAPMKRVNLKLLSLRPAKCTAALVTMLKLKGRLPDVPSRTENAPTTKHGVTTGTAGAAVSREAPTTKASHNDPRTTNEATSPEPTMPPSISQPDLAAALSAVTVLVRGTEESIMRSVTSDLQSIRMGLLQQKQQQEQQAMFLQQQQAQALSASQTLIPILEAQKRQMEQQSQLLQQQQELIQQQAEQMEQFARNQKQLLDAIAELRNETIARSGTNHQQQLKDTDLLLEKISCGQDEVLKAITLSTDNTNGVLLKQHRELQHQIEENAKAALEHSEKLHRDPIEAALFSECSTGPSLFSTQMDLLSAPPSEMQGTSGAHSVPGGNQNTEATEDLTAEVGSMPSTQEVSSSATEDDQTNTRSAESKEEEDLLGMSDTVEKENIKR